MINSNHVCQLCNGCTATDPNKHLLPFYDYIISIFRANTHSRDRLEWRLNCKYFQRKRFSTHTVLRSIIFGYVPIYFCNSSRVLFLYLTTDHKSMICKTSNGAKYSVVGFPRTISISSHHVSISGRFLYMKHTVVENKIIKLRLHMDKSSLRI